MKKYKNVCNCKYNIGKLLILALLWVGISSSNIVAQALRVKKMPVSHDMRLLLSEGIHLIKMTDLDVQVVKSSGDKFVITYNVTGQIKLPGNRGYIITQVYVTEYSNKDKALDYFRVIDITPIPKYIGKKNNGQDFEYFRFENEYKIRSMYKSERVKVICGDKEQIIELK